MRTMLSTILEAPVARQELAALFLAASAAWEVAVREHGWRAAAGGSEAGKGRRGGVELGDARGVAGETGAEAGDAHRQPPLEFLSPSPLPHPSPPAPSSPTAAQTHVFAHAGPPYTSSPQRRPRHETSTPATSAAVAASAAAAAEQRALARFCTHHGHCCAACQSGAAIEGPRYACVTCHAPAPSLCAACWRAGRGCPAPGVPHTRFTVLDHPWEADSTYAAAPLDVLAVPRAPLRRGDVGPRVVHLHYVLYKMGYLRVSDTALVVGVFCERTRDAIERFQRDHDLVEATVIGWEGEPQVGAGPGGGAVGAGLEQTGTFCEATRSAILTLFQEVEARYTRVRCRGTPPADPARFRTATAA
jgi:hypothetical protein